MRVGTFLMSGLILVLSSGCASYVATSGRVVFTDEKATIDVIFSNRDRQVIYDYYRGRKGQKKEKSPARTGETGRRSATGSGEARHLTARPAGPYFTRGSRGAAGAVAAELRSRDHRCGCRSVEPGYARGARRDLRSRELKA